MNKEYYAKFRIYYEDTDSGGIVYYANYLKFFERARTEVLREINVSQFELVNRDNLIFVVMHCDISYKKPAKLDDLIEVKTTVEKIGSTSMTMNQEIFLGDELLNILNVKIVCIDNITKRPKKIPLEIKNKLSQ